MKDKWEARLQWVRLPFLRVRLFLRPAGSTRYRENVSAFVDTPWKIVFRFLKRLVFFPKSFFHGVPNNCLSKTMKDFVERLTGLVQHSKLISF